MANPVKSSGSKCTLVANEVGSEGLVPSAAERQMEVDAKAEVRDSYRNKRQHLY